MSNIKDLFNATAYDKAGDKLGSVKEVFVDDNSGQPTFVEVNHGLFGMNSSLVPLRGHKFDGKDLNLAFSKDRIKDAPNLDADQALTPDQQNEVLRHYGVDGLEDQTRYEGVQSGRTEQDRGVHSENGEVADRNRVAADRGAADRDRVAAKDGEMIRSEEQLDVNKERVATGEARLRKYVVTDSETVEVPVTREEVRVERTPINANEAANHNARIGEDEASVTLHEERVDVSKNTVPVEKVNLGKQEVTETERHTEELRKERIDVDGVEGHDNRK